jgi:formylglycine-generating enzyme required for sulfatase activity
MEQNPKNTWQSPTFTASEQRPVVCVEYADAKAFCDWLSQIEGRHYEVPHESVWEFACRAGTTGLWPWSDDPSDFEKFVQLDRHPVGGKPANAFGLYDMIGNVGEFTRVGELPRADDQPFVYRNAGVHPSPWFNRPAKRNFSFGVYLSRDGMGFRVAIVGDLKPKASGAAASGFSDDPAPRPLDGPPLAIAPFDEEQAKQHQKTWAKHLGVPVEITNAIGMKLRLIPPGEFTMGSSPEQIQRAVSQAPDYAKGQPKYEGPARRVRIAEPCYVGVHEVTVGEFRRFVKETEYKTVPETDGLGSWGWAGKDIVQSPKFTWQAAMFAAPDTMPVVCVEYADAQKFCEWLGRIDGRRYEIPHESVWEFACRAGTTGLWPWGDQPEDFGRFAYSDAHPVGGKPANPFGLYDMIGNVQEFARADDKPFVYRGGGGGTSPWLIRSAFRAFSHGVYQSSFCSGFRVAIVGDPKLRVSQAAGRFVVPAQDANPERKFATLAEAVAAAQAGDTIEIRGDGPFFSDRVQIAKPLRIRAANGFRPVITFSHEPVAWWSSVIDVAAPLVVEGIEFRYARPATGGVVQFFGVTSKLHMAHCRVVAEGETNGIWLCRGRVELDHCLILGSNWSTFRWNFDGAAQLSATDSILVAPQAIVTLHSSTKRDETPDLTVHLNRSTASSCDQVLLWLVDEAQPELKKGHKPIHWHGVESVFSLSNPEPRMVCMACKATDYQETAPVRALLQGTVAWSEDRNVYPTQPLVELENSPNNMYRRLPDGYFCGNLDEWCKFWGIPSTKSVQGMTELAGGKIMDEFVANIHKVTAANFGLVKGSPGQGVLPGGKDLGADVDRVGPGKSYEDWKKTDEYKDWQKKTDELMNARSTSP